MNWDWETQGDPCQSMSPEEVMDLQINIFKHYQYYLSAADKEDSVDVCSKAEKLDFPKRSRVDVINFKRCDLGKGLSGSRSWTLDSPTGIGHRGLCVEPRWLMFEDRVAAGQFIS